MSDTKTPAKQPPRMMPFGRPMMGAMPGEKAKDFKGTLTRLVSYLKPYWVRIVLVLLFAVCSTIFSIASPKILGQATNQIVSDYVKIRAFNQMGHPATVAPPTFHIESIRYIALLLVVMYVISSAFSYIQGWIMTDVTQKVTFNFRKDISEKINRLPLSYFDNRTYGEVLSRVTNDVDTVSQTLNQSMSQIVTAVVTIVGIAIMMLSISWLLTLVTLLILPLSFILLGQIMKRSQLQFIRQQQGLGLINGHVEEMYAGHMVMRVFNGEKDSVAKFEKINNDLYGSAWKAQFFSGLMFPLMAFVGNLGYVGVAVVGGWLAFRGQIQIGDIQAFIQYVQQFNQPITQTANMANVLQSTAAAAERVFEFLAETEEIADSKNPVVLKEVKGKVEFDHVVFGYHPDKTIIKNLSAKVHPGQRIAIVGPTGAGKTTLVNLLMRFYDVKSGAIRIDGVDIKEMKRQDVRQMFGMVLQDTWLFNGSIRDNITYGRPNATEAEMVEAAKEAHVDHFVRSLSNGYDMVINEEASNISAGEKQLLTIARAMLAKTPMLILDEATSSVDTRTEILIQKAMDNLMKDKTCFIIAHRLSTIRDADLILVMKDGNVVEQGTHHELLKMKGFYASLYNSQFAEN